ncbi:hypothetical protein EDB85DRAFT_2211360 [Lactarius pseudohatsudake]|nr:hypothetical protein EDB85DRAFT_2211360 [Lactarius pseudohatsudake]
MPRRRKQEKTKRRTGTPNAHHGHDGMQICPHAIAIVSETQRIDIKMSHHWQTSVLVVLRLKVLKQATGKSYQKAAFEEKCQLSRGQNRNRGIRCMTYRLSTLSQVASMCVGVEGLEPRAERGEVGNGNGGLHRARGMSLRVVANGCAPFGAVQNFA